MQTFKSLIALPRVPGTVMLFSDALQKIEPRPLSRLFLQVRP